MTTALATPTTTTSDLRVLIDQNRLPDADRQEAEALHAQIAGVHVKAQQFAATGEFTPTGLAKVLEPHRQPVERALTAFETRTKTEHEKLEATKAAIERGDLVRTAAGTFEPVAYAEPSTPVELARLQFTWQQLRTMDRSERRMLVLRADESGERELLTAIRLAPKSFPVTDELLDRELAGNRWERAGWKAEYQSSLDRLTLRQMIGRKARTALGLSED